MRDGTGTVAVGGVETLIFFGVSTFVSLFGRLNASTFGGLWDGAGVGKGTIGGAGTFSLLGVFSTTAPRVRGKALGDYSFVYITRIRLTKSL